MARAVLIQNVLQSDTELMYTHLKYIKTLRCTNCDKMPDCTSAEDGVSNFKDPHCLQKLFILLAEKVCYRCFAISDDGRVDMNCHVLSLSSCKR